MADDLVQRLRHMAKLLGFDLTALLNDAADEIERLREIETHYENAMSAAEDHRFD